VLSDPAGRVVVVEHSERVARLRAGHLQAARDARGGRLVAADPGAVSDVLACGM